MPHLAAPASPPPAPNLMSDAREAASSSPPSERGRRKAVVVVMGATGAGKSRLAVDLARHFAGVEVVSADSMQVYRGLDVLTNKVSLDEQNGLSSRTLQVSLLVFLTISLASSILPWSSLAVISVIMPCLLLDFQLSYRHVHSEWPQIIEDILDRGGLPVVVGGTNFYIQALVSPFLFEDMSEDMQGCTLSDQLDDIGLATDDVRSGYEHLKEIDPIAAQRIHPNNHRKIKRYLELYATTGVLPSDLFQGEAAEDKWGRPTSSRFDCCFLWVDAELHVLDNYVNERVDCMINAGLLDEVRNIYNPGAVYTQGLRQAIGVREFDEFFRLYFTKKEPDEIKAGMLDLHDDKLKSLLDEAVSQLKANTRRLVRRQRRRLHQLNKDFGWNLHHIDATEAFQCTTGDSWHVKVIKPCADTVRRFLSNDTTLASKDSTNDGGGTRLASRELWTQYVCEACDNRVLRGAHEWEQHKQGRGHRKRTQRLKRKSKIKSTSSEAEV
ncbi:tRNA dimethylallyltransferase 2 [Triticum urartu]|uniref:tRNA dimethylallyltransferase 2 n=1 Tax=Triticum urartu TaxID=4572 RepID=M7YTH8_TRIUA|nr:tRNA dimethylallyltransferase 2 [Triticum urartu]